MLKKKQKYAMFEEMVFDENFKANLKYKSRSKSVHEESMSYFLKN